MIVFCTLCGVFPGAYSRVGGWGTPPLVPTRGCAHAYAHRDDGINSGLSGKDNGARAFFFPRTPIFFQDHFIFLVGKSPVKGEDGFAMAALIAKRRTFLSHPLGRGRTNSRPGTPAFRGRIVSPGNRCPIRPIRRIRPTRPTSPTKGNN